jgi:hypothetical protein
MRRFMAIVAGVFVVTAIAGGALVGCGVSKPGSGSPRDTTLPRVNCGSAATRFLGESTQVLSATSGALPCFAAAARNCRPASITVTAMGVDAGTRYVFVVKPGTDGCQVTEQSQFYVVSGGVRHGPLTIVGCQRTAVTASGVTLECGGRRILIPATASGTPG